MAITTKEERHRNDYRTTVEDSVILKYEQTLSVCFVGRVWEGERGMGGGVSASQSVCVSEGEWGGEVWGRGYGGLPL